MKRVLGSSTADDGEPNVASEASTPPSPRQPSKAMAEVSSMSIVRISSSGGHINSLSKIVGVHAPRGDPKAMADQWNSLAMICALMTGVAAAGMFMTSEYVQGFREARLEELESMSVVDGLPLRHNGTAGWLRFSLPIVEKHRLAKWTMMMWCVDTFCFLNATVMATFFVAFVSRHPDHDIQQVHEELGMAFHWPQIYFRVGYVVMVASLASFFILVMDLIEMGGCLLFCVTLMVAPMFYAMSRAFSVFAIVESPPPVVRSEKDPEQGAMASGHI